MKKIHGLLLLANAILLGACTPNTQDNEKVPLYYRHNELTEIIEFTDVKDVDDMITDKENFILVSYADYTCSCWGRFRDFVLNPYINETKLPIYVIATDLMGDDLKGLPINRNKTNTPVIGIFEAGKVKFSLAYNQDETVFQQLDKFTSWIERYIELPMMTYISLEELNTLLSGTTPFLLNWSYNRCPDCKALDGRMMPVYLKENTITQKIPYYIIETAEIRKLESWTDVKNTYGLSNVLNERLGYGTGYVPTLQIFHPDGSDYVTSGDVSPIMTDMLVFQNEFVEKVEGVYKVKDSYWNGVRGTTYLGTYESEIGKVIDPSMVEETETSIRFVAGSRYELNARYAAKFLDYYWK
ncbi:MAG: hypothetical protein WC968_03210 [Bacilli bacterium]